MYIDEIQEKAGSTKKLLTNCTKRNIIVYCIKMAKLPLFLVLYHKETAFSSANSKKSDKAGAHRRSVAATCFSCKNRME
jgi:hypothetical protein